MTGRRSKPESQVMVALGERFQFHLKHSGAQIREADSLDPLNAMDTLVYCVTEARSQPKKRLECRSI